MGYRRIQVFFELLVKGGKNMLFIPRDGVLWDTFLMKKGDKYHMFHLHFASSLGHAVSDDLAHWKEEPTIEFSIPGSWHQGGATLTGAILEKDGKYWYAVGCMDNNGFQVYGFAVSEDLYQWTMVDKNAPSLVVGSDFYDHDTKMGNSGWRDTAFRTDEQGWVHCYLCANTHKPNQYSSGAAIGHVRSKDLKNWEYLPPLASVGDKVGAAECPSMLEIDGKWYLTFVDHGSGGMRWHASGYEDGGGTYYMVANNPDGPFRYTANPMLLGSGNDRQESWAGRAAKIDGKWLMYSHMSAKNAFANLKEIVRSEDGGLELKYFPAMEKLICVEPMKLHEPKHIEGSGPRGWKDLGKWLSSGITITGECMAMGSGVQLAEKTDSFILDADVIMQEGASLGFALRTHDFEGVSRFPGMPAPREHGAAVIRLDYQLGRAEIEELTRVSYAGYGHNDFMNSTFVRNPDRRAVKLEYGIKYHLKIIARGPYYELYIDDRFILCKQLGTTVEGGLEAIVERGRARFEDITLSPIEPL